MVNLIDIEDIQDVRAIAETVDDVNRVDPFILEAQQVELKRLLGDELYYDLVKNSEAEKYADLLDGKEYETSSGKAAEFQGLKIVLAYFAYARFLINDNMKHTDAGFVVKTTQYSQPVSNSQLQARYQDARSTALAFWEDCSRFLDCNRDTYPLWRCGSVTHGLRSGLKISAVSNRHEGRRRL